MAHPTDWDAVKRLAAARGPGMLKICERLHECEMLRNMWPPVQADLVKATEMQAASAAALAASTDHLEASLDRVVVLTERLIALEAAHEALMLEHEDLQIAYDVLKRQRDRAPRQDD